MTQLNEDFWGGIVFTVLIAVVISLLLLTTSAISDDLPNIEIPTCPEDSVLVGTGNFYDGHWTNYACGPSVDDYQRN